MSDMGDTRAAGLDPAIAAGIRRYLDEATAGPVNGGIVGELVAGPFVVEAYASRDWGVEFARVLPGGRRVTAHVDGASPSAAYAAVASLIA